MTDGIIQQVFNKWWEGYTNCNCDFCRIVKPESIELMQELIEKIKKELKFMQYNRLDQHQHLAITGHKLLGDYLGDSKE